MKVKLVIEVGMHDTLAIRIIQSVLHVPQTELYKIVAIQKANG